MRPELDAFWMPFTANRQFKKAPRLLAKASGMHYTDGVVVDVTAQLENSFLLSLPPMRFVTTRGQFGPIVVARYLVPEFAPPGQYKLTIENVFHVNPIRDWVYVVETEIFTVLPEHPDG